MPRAALLACLALAACGGVPASDAPADAPVSAPAAVAVAPGETLAFGAVGIACGLSPSALGPPVDERAGYALHDSAPGLTEPRTHWITGFADGCPRQVTAALVLFGDVAMREAIRHANPGLPSDATDAAYEQIKATVCGGPPGEPCGAATERLAADTVFVSLYPAFGAEEHANLLLHAGEVVAADG